MTSFCTGSLGGRGGAEASFRGLPLGRGGVASGEVVVRFRRRGRGSELELEGRSAREVDARSEEVDGGLVGRSRARERRMVVLVQRDASRRRLAF